MARITLAVGKGFSGEIFKCEVEDTLKVEEVLRKFVNLIYEGDREANDFVLFNLSRGFEYRNDDRLSDAGTKSGDIVLLIDLKKI